MGGTPKQIGVQLHQDVRGINHMPASLQGQWPQPLSYMYLGKKERDILAQVTSVWPSRVWLGKGDDGRGLGVSWSGTNPTPHASLRRGMWLG